MQSLSGKFAKRGERCHDETCTRWFFIRYVTLKRCYFFQICSFFVFSRSILCLNLSLLATLVLSSEHVSYRCARARKHLQSSFLCIICSWTTPREEEISRPHRPQPRRTKSSPDSLSSFLSFFLRFASSIGGMNFEPISGTFSTTGNFSQTKCISFFPYLDTESKRNGRRDSSGTQHPPIHITVIVLRTLRRVFFFVSALASPAAPFSFVLFTPRPHALSPVGPAVCSADRRLLPRPPPRCHGHRG